MAQLVEGLHRHGLPVVLVDALEHGPGGPLAQHAGGAPHVVGGPPEERHDAGWCDVVYFLFML